MSPRRQILLLPAGAAAGLWLLWGSGLPLGIPGEWTWPRIPLDAESVAGWLTALLAGGLYIAFVFLGGRYLERAGRLAAAAWVSALVLCGCGWLLSLVESVPGIAGISRTHFVLYYQRSSGYFWQARYEVDGTAEFLAGYEALLAEGDFLHIGTHPPGLTLFFRGVLNVLDDAPGLTAAVNATQPQPVRDAAELIRTQSLATGRLFTAADEACLWAAALIAALLSAATVAPLYALLRQSCDRPTAWYSAALWPLLPAVAVFFPKSDVIFPFFSVLGPCLWWSGWRRGSLACCASAGATLWIAMLLSLAIAPVAIFTALWTLLEELRPQAPDSPGRSTQGKIACIAAAAAGFFLPIALVAVLADLNLLRVWSWNVRNHAAFYDHNTRTWWKWLLVNPLETALAAGVPLMIAAALGFARADQPAASRSRPHWD